ncbi:MAG: [protein-PII] uridylyltransferase [Verrucomicrobia bacterium]|nr:[protein-PII] uridylyltransferase [Verrucomicrobiota bacterium]
MRTLAEKIAQDARRRLVLPAGHEPAQQLAAFRKYLKIEFQRLKMLHRAGGGGREVSRARATVVDELMRHLWAGARHEGAAQGPQALPPVALVALGGYGRAELSPFSDVDLMFLHEGQVVADRTKPLPALRKLMDGVLLPLWDLGFKVGHSVRTIADCVQAANDPHTPKSMETKTSLIEARLISGHAALFEKFQRAVTARCVRGHEVQYLESRLQDQAARRARHGDSPTMQEPNLKNGCGGLRDYQNLHWMALFRHRTRTLADLEREGWITGAERKQLDRAYDFLLRVRGELHYQAGRSQDVLLRALQPAVALELGYAERSPTRRLEQFMRDLYTHMRHLYLTTRTLEERLALAPQRGRLAALGQFLAGPFRRPQAPALDGFRIDGRHLHEASPRVFRDQPRRMMRAFLYAQQRGLRLHPDLARHIRHELSLANRSFLNDPHVRETFLEILNQRGTVGRTLRAMHEVGLLGKYLPEFGRLTCLVQHEFYHVYSADEHTLQCLEQLDRLAAGGASAHPQYAAMFQEVERPFVLHLALLLHDAAKALRTGNHAGAGGPIALRAARRLSLDGTTTDSLRLLVEHHLLMARISQRRDLDDPDVIESFAAQVQSVETLRMLTLLTLADALGTSVTLWNGFKDALLLELHHKTARALAGTTELVSAEIRQRERLADEVARAVKRGVTREEIAAHFSGMPSRYFAAHGVREIAADLMHIRRFISLQPGGDTQGLEPVVLWQTERDRGYSQAKICTWDRPGLFSRITAAFSAAGINILAAQVFTRADALVLDTFFGTDARTGTPVSPDQRAQFERTLKQALTDHPFNLATLIHARRPARTPYQRLAGDGLPTAIRFDNTASATRTVIEIETEDRLGLLFALSHAMAGLQLDLSVAKILTEKGAAVDTFYVTERNGDKILAPERQEIIRTRLLAALADVRSKVVP